MNAENFKNPPKEYREVPFWSWNDDLETGELLRQIDEMDKQGWGGFFMHSRKGLVTEYLSDEWMARIMDCIEEAGKRGMGAWLYDEDKWPSGFCGGKIPLLGGEYRQKALLMREGELELCPGDVELLKTYAATKVGSRGYSGITCIDEAGAEQWQKNGFTILRFFKWTQPIGPNRFNNTAWVDLLNPSVTEAFLESTHEKYARYAAKEFGKTVPGIFTDESTILYWAYAPKTALPWSQHFEEYFLKEHGYNIGDHLPYLFIDMAGFERIRYDYWKVVTGCFVENYVRKVFEWCEKHNLKYTGHFMAEDYFEFTMQYIGSLMPAYEYMHIPGADHLNRNINDVMTVKQVTSVAHQLGKERTLCEMFGCGGQNFSFEHHKWIADWNFIHGMNLINPHLSLYSMRGERKRDYPPNLFYQQPWWEHSRKMADYCARLSYILSRGNRVTDVLVLHSIESAWCCYNPTDVVLDGEGQLDTPDTWIEYQPSRKFKVNDLSFKFNLLINMLLRLHYDYDLGDEAIIAGHGSTEGGMFKVGQAAYSVVIVPSSITLRSSTVKLLKDFAQSGGTLIFMDELPYLVDGRPAPGMLDAVTAGAFVLPLDEVQLKQCLDSCISNRVTVEGDGNEEVWYHLRKFENKTVVFFANTDREKEKTAALRIGAKGHAEQWDIFKGDVCKIPFTYDENAVKLTYTFPPAGSLLLVIDEGRKPEPAQTPVIKQIESIELEDKWEIRPADKNCLTLDYCRLDNDGCEAADLMPVHRALGKVMELRKDFCLSYFFEVDSWNGSGGTLVAESVRDFDIRLNGVPVNGRFGDGHWLDRSFKTCDIADLVKPGTNVVELKAIWHEDIEVEAIYILGDFRVENRSNREFSLVDMAGRITAGNLVQQGYPFYTGRMSFRSRWTPDGGETVRYFVEVEQEGSIAVELSVNGKKMEAGFVRPYIWDITQNVLQGENDIEIILTTSLHNLLGPHHSTKGEIIACAPASFRDETTWTDAYFFIELGLRRVRIHKYST